MRQIEIELTEGNIKHHHFYLGQHLQFFPSQSIGGSCRSADMTLLLQLGSSEVQQIHTDIDGSNNVFRQHSWMADFFSEHRLQARDRIVIKRLASGQYQVLARKMTPPSRG
ncbi:hypothetical protein [uncultured Ferrimonas sp.]|uniref:hypothetical protein n=1 Tax=uncultured Ferrimonas sp. TaxID=432640 RepID=UPI00263648F7|nr:hypothetical protein [uncultured Ferrimonas sp.]